MSSCAVAQEDKSSCLAGGYVVPLYKKTCLIVWHTKHFLVTREDMSSRDTHRVEEDMSSCVVPQECLLRFFLGGLCGDWPGGDYG